ncbi:MAG: hypothetical protein WDO56_19375 [Gammaproteobacteria bacterium]
MNDQRNTDQTHFRRRGLIQAAGLAAVGPVKQTYDNALGAGRRLAAAAR